MASFHVQNAVSSLKAMTASDSNEESLLQDKVHVLKVPVKEPQTDGPALLQALSYLEEEPEQAKAMGLAGARLVEEALPVDSNEGDSSNGFPRPFWENCTV